MEMLSKKSKCFVIALLSFCLIILPAYLSFSILDDSDVTPSYPVFEKIDQDDSILSPEQREEIFNLTFFVKHILIAQPFLAWVSNLSDQSSALNSKSLILRC
jgi:hypothetical protein